MAHTDRQWYIVQFFKHGSNDKPVGTSYFYCHDVDKACRLGEANCYASYPGCYHRVDQIRDDLVPIVKRGLTEATTEEIRDELAKRGWKVTS